MHDDDVPSPIDFHDLAQATEWVEQTVKNRPSRPQFFSAFVRALNTRYKRPFSILELGSGPGHLAERILGSCTVSCYIALDFSAAMHQLARARLKPFLDKIDFAERDFRSPDWTANLPVFDAVITMQAAHEVRHRRYLPALLGQTRQVLSRDGLFLYCDHYAVDNPLFLRPEDQPAALRNAGFSAVQKILKRAEWHCIAPKMRVHDQVPENSSPKVRTTWSTTTLWFPPPSSAPMRRG